MKTSTEIYSLAKHVGEERAIELLARAGFDAYDFSMFLMCRLDSNQSLAENSHPLAGADYLKFARQLRRTAEACGIECNQSHAPFPVSNPHIRSHLKRAIECTAEAGGRICIIHPDNNKSAEENAELYFELLPFAKEHKVKIATENMWNWNKEEDHASAAACSHHIDFLRHIEAVNDEYLVACLDVGHSEMAGLDTSSVEMIKTLGSHLQALHLHDNDLRRDLHQLPFSQKIDFAPIVAALKQIGYSGYFTLEADNFLGAFTAESLSEGVSLLYQSCRKLCDMYENS